MRKFKSNTYRDYLSKILKFIITAIIFMLTMSFARYLSAEEPTKVDKVLERFYFGVSYSNINNAHIQQSLSRPIIGTLNFDKSYGVFAGYSFNDYIGLEVSGNQFGSKSERVTHEIEGEPGIFHKWYEVGNYTGYNLNLDLIFRYTMLQKYSPYVRLGYAYNSMDDKHADTCPMDGYSFNFCSIHYKGKGANIGIGFDYNIYKGNTIGIEYKYTKTSIDYDVDIIYGSNILDVADMNYSSISIRYKHTL